MTETQFRTRYPFWTTVTLRFSDQDSTGHINNVSFAAYIEAGRVAFGWHHTRPLMTPAQDLFMANLSIAYRNQVRYPGNVEVGTGVKKIGRTSITLGHAVHRDDGALAAEAESVVVLVDRAAGKSEPISDSIRAILGADALAMKA
jgi:acyl-CoA thioester hydrolase